MTEHESQAQEEPGRHGHDRVTTSPVGVMAAGIGLLALTAFAMILMVRMTLFFERDSRDERDRDAGERAAPTTAAEIPPPPRVQPNQQLQLQRQTTEKLQILTSYGWVDEAEGIARIPIERAMDLVAERGLDPWTSTGAAQSTEAAQGTAPQTPNQPQPEGNRDDATN